MEVLDQSHDLSGREQHRLLQLYTPPEFVKNASHLRLYGEENQPRHLYAEPAQKLYPCHTAPATWLSTLFFLEKQAYFDESTIKTVTKNLDQAITYFGLQREIDELRAKFAANEGKAEAQLPDEDFAIVWKVEGKDTERHWPLRNAQEVKAAADHYARHRDQFAYNDRRTIATKILEKAASYGAGLGDNDYLLNRAAGLGGCSARMAAELMEARATMVRQSHAELSGEMRKAAGIIRQHPEQARGLEQLYKIAQIIDQFDHETGLAKLYSQGLERPEDILFQITEKVAEDAEKSYFATLSGNHYQVGDMTKLSVDHIRSWMGDDFTSAVTDGDIYVDPVKVAAVAPTLDRGTLPVFERMLEAAQIRPVMQDAQTGPGTPLIELAKAAAAYVPTEQPELPSLSLSVLD